MTRMPMTVKTILCALLIAGPAQADDFKLLFNGRDLSGWQPVAGAAGHWKVQDGLLYCAGGGGWLSTTEEFDNFELELEFRVPEGGNSGVFLRAPQVGNPAYAGMEIQVLDDHAEKYADLRPTQYTGSIYDVVAASPRVTKKAGAWQKMQIRCDGRHVQVTLNGTRIVDADLDQHADKVETHPGLKRTGGHIGLQNHGSRLDYRNLRIRPLP